MSKIIFSVSCRKNMTHFAVRHILWAFVGFRCWFSSVFAVHIIYHNLLFAELERARARSLARLNTAQQHLISFVYLAVFINSQPHRTARKQRSRSVDELFLDLAQTMYWHEWKKNPNEQKSKQNVSWDVVTLSGWAHGMHAHTHTHIFDMVTFLLSRCATISVLILRNKPTNTQTIWWISSCTWAFTMWTCVFVCVYIVRSPQIHLAFAANWTGR